MHRAWIAWAVRARILGKDRVKGAVFESLEYGGFGTNGNVMVSLEAIPDKGTRGRVFQQIQD
jgi:hypothetical protein